MKSCEFTLDDAVTIMIQQTMAATGLSEDSLRPKIEALVQRLLDNGVVLCALEGTTNFQAAASSHLPPSKAIQPCKSVSLAFDMAVGMITNFVAKEVGVSEAALHPKISAIVDNLQRQGIVFCALEGYDLFRVAVQRLFAKAA